MLCLHVFVLYKLTLLSPGDTFDQQSGAPVTHGVVPMWDTLLPGNRLTFPLRTLTLALVYSRSTVFDFPAYFRGECLRSARRQKREKSEACESGLIYNSAALGTRL